MQRSTITLALLLFACGPGKDESTSAATAGSTGPVESTGAVESTTATEPTSTGGNSTTTGTSTPTTSTGSDPGTTTGTTGPVKPCADQVPSDVPDMCASQVDREGCNAVGLEDSLGRCLWIPWFGVELSDDTCTFGPPRGVCSYIRCSLDGCPELSPCGDSGFGGAFVVGQDDKVSVAFAEWCDVPPAPAQPCIFDADQQVVEGPPECACLCDPDFPGA